jgi:hypothetical protein
MIATIFGWVCVACLVLTAMLEPKEPKRDGRFKTGYKNNAKMPNKSEDVKKAQIALLVIAAASGIVWYMVK